MVLSLLRFEESLGARDRRLHMSVSSSSIQAWRTSLLSGAQLTHRGLGAPIEQG